MTVMALLGWQALPDIVAATAFLDADFFVSIAEGILAWVVAIGRRSVVWFAIVGPVVYVAARWLASRKGAGEADTPTPGITQEAADSWASTLPASVPDGFE